MTDGLEAARRTLLDDYGYHDSGCEIGPSWGVFCTCAYPTAVRAFEEAVRATERARASESALRAAAQEALRLVNQARQKLFAQDECPRPDAPDLAAFEEASSGCQRCQELLWGYQSMTGTVEPADNLNSSLYDAERALKAALDGAPYSPDMALRAVAREALDWLDRCLVYGNLPQDKDDAVSAFMDKLRGALDGAPWEPSEEQVERAAAEIQRLSSHVPFAKADRTIRRWRIEEARAALKAAMGIESGSAG